MRTLPAILVLTTLLGLSQVARAEPAGRLIASAASGLEPGGNPKIHKLILRCTLQELPSGQPLRVYLPPSHSESLESVLKGVLKWSEFAFERQRSTLEQRAGHLCYFRKNSDAEVLEAVMQDPGGVGILSSSLPLPPDVLDLWPNTAPKEEPSSPSTQDKANQEPEKPKEEE